MKLIKECIPHKNVCVRPDDQPLYDSAIRRVSRKRERMKSAAKKTGKSNHWSKYKNLRNTINNMKKYAKKEFFNNLETNLTDLQCNDKKSFWKIKYFHLYYVSHHCANYILMGKQCCTLLLMIRRTALTNVLHQYPW